MTNSCSQPAVAALVLAVVPLLSPSAWAAQTDADARANAFFERAQDEYYELDPTAAARIGLRVRYGEWTDNSEAGDLARRRLAERQLAELHATVRRDELGSEARLSYDLFEDLQRRRIEAWRWRNHGYLFNQMWGLQSVIPAFMINTHHVDSESDAEDYVRRLRAVLRHVATALERTDRAERRGILPPRFVFARVLSDARNVISGWPFDDGPEDSPLAADFKTKVASLGLAEERQAALVASAERALLESIEPAYRAIIAWAGAAESRAGTDDGVWKLPHGRAYYAYRLATYTTTGLTAEEIHELGLREVARLQAEMRAVMRQTGFEGSLQDFFEFIRTDDRFYYADTPEGRANYIADATGIIGAMRARLSELFVTLPQADVVVKAVEPFRERSAGKAFYQRPTADGTHPGVFYVNLYDMRDMPRTEMEALAYHEGVPGHHMQITVAGEQDALPRFRRFGGYSAFSEGWGLYSERLPKELGFYADPYSEFGRLTLEIIRAVRLVVDTGLHARRWTREQVIRYHLENTPLPEGAVVKATERYIVSAGQATAYMVGMLRILELRERAASALGERFDIREFHELILRNGPVPLGLLEQQVDAWIASRRG